MAASLSRPPPQLLQPAALAQKLRACLPQEPPQGCGHDDDNPDLGALEPGGIKAAVLLPLVARTEPVLLFTRRTLTLATHSGQVSFPGGRIEAFDPSPLAAALRETQEETGIGPEAVTMAGYLARYRTGTGFDIQPVVGVLAPGFVLRPDAAEVAATFEVPLAFFRDPANRRHETRPWHGRERSVYSFTYGGHEIWGATAAILVELVTRLDDGERR